MFFGFGVLYALLMLFPMFMMIWDGYVGRICDFRCGMGDRTVLK